MTETDPIIAEALRIEEDTDHSGRSNFVAARISDRIHIALGAPAAGLAAAAGTTALADLPWVAAGCAFGATLLGALQTFLRADKRAAQHQSVGVEYIDVRNEARIFRTIDYPNLADEERRERIHELSGRRSDLNRSTPRIPDKAFQRARRSIEAGESSYVVDTGTAGDGGTRP